MGKFDKYLFRSHMVGKIINVPKPLTKTQQGTLDQYITGVNGSGNPLTPKQKDTLLDLKYKLKESKIHRLTDGQKKILSELVFFEKYGRKNEINSNKLKKGLQKEKESRDLLSRCFGRFFTSCEERKTNDYVTGAIDIKPEDVIIDIKTSWSWKSFCGILQDKPNEIYLRQGDSYMDLWGVKDFLLCHVLVDTPFDMVEQEIRRFDFQNNILNMEGEVREEFIGDVIDLVSNFIFTRKGIEDFCQQSTVIEIDWFKSFVEIPDNERVHMIPHSFDKSRIEQRNECIKIAREYMNNCKPLNNFDLTLIK